MSRRAASAAKAAPADDVDQGRGRGYARSVTDKDPSDSFRRRLEGVIPELVKRAVEIGVEKAHEAPDAVKQMVGDLKLPKEIAGYIFSQVDETKNGLFRIFAKEMRDFLEHTNIAGEMQKMLTTVQFEINTTIRFRPNDGKREPKAEPADKTGGSIPPPESVPPPGSIPRPEVFTDVVVKRPQREE
jgi:hypothetical protein